MWFLGHASSGLLQNNNLRERKEEKQGYCGQLARKCLSDSELTFNRRLEFNERNTVRDMWKEKTQYKKKSLQRKNQEEREAKSETGEVVPTLRMFIHPLWSFHVLGLLPL